MKCELVYIDFLDHGNTTMDDLRTFPCLAAGLLVKEDEDHYYLAHWLSEKEAFCPQSDGQIVVKHPAAKLIKSGLFVEVKGE